jgi:acetyltransferase-like isoleucine patch superfamily enzyme
VRPRRPRSAAPPQPAPTLFSLLRKFIRYQALEHGRWPGLYVRTCQPRGEEYAEYLRRHGKLFSVGTGNCIQVSTDIVDPDYVRIGNDCIFSTCALIGHDASVSVLNRALGKNIDSVGKIDIKDNCFVGYGAIVLPGVTIGPNSIVAAGALVNRDVPPNTVVAGVPAKPLCGIEELAAKLEAKSDELPWRDLIEKRGPDYDPAFEPELIRARVRHMFGEGA